MALLQTTITATYARPAIGTTAQRPGSPSAGAMRYNTDLKYTEIYDGLTWSKFSHSATIKNHADVVSASGQHITYQSDVYKVHQFINAGTHTFTPRYSGTIEVLCIAGGGGGSRHSGAGGGAGGLVYSSAFAVTAGSAIAVTVGAGGLGAGNGGQRYGVDAYSEVGNNGANSIVAGGINLVTNGTFDTNTTGWDNRSQGTLSVSSGQLVITGAVSFAGAQQAIQTIPNKQYRITGNRISVGSGSTSYVQVGTGSGTSSASFDLVNVDTTMGAFTYDFVATTTITYVTLQTSAVITTAVFDNIVVSPVIIAIGGGRGGNHISGGLTGGSGGGSARSQGAGAAGTPGQGFAGGTSSFFDPNYPAAGGGGAGGVGGSSSNTRGGDGGPGLAFSISGKSKWYAGGGGGNIQSGGFRGGSGGAGGGGTGADAGAGSGNLVLLGANGEFWTGSGGGGSHYDATFGGGYNRYNQANGADGIVIIRYVSVNPQQIVQIFTNTAQIGNGEGPMYWPTPVGVNRVETLVVAGGGGGGTANASSGYGGGGGAGGLLYHQSYPVATNFTYSITCGFGGNANGNGTNSQLSQFAGTAVLTAIGGGAGASSHQSAGTAGGSGGGGSTSSAAGGAGTAGQGFAGGQGNLQASGDTGCGGGGGAGGVGSGTGSNNNGFNQGGAGVLYGITGEPVYFAAGGTGSAVYSGSYVGLTVMNAGSTNGASGFHPTLGLGPVSTTISKDAVQYTGSGGGGGRISGDTGGLGGSGIVVLRWYSVQS